MLKKKKTEMKFPIWLNEISRVSAVPGCRLDPAWHSGLKDPALLQLQHRLQLQLRSEPWPWNPINLQGSLKKKKRLGVLLWHTTG